MKIYYRVFLNFEFNNFLKINIKTQIWKDKFVWIQIAGNLLQCNAQHVLSYNWSLVFSVHRHVLRNYGECISCLTRKEMKKFNQDSHLQVQWDHSHILLPEKEKYQIILRDQIMQKPVNQTLISNKLPTRPHLFTMKKKLLNAEKHVELQEQQLILVIVQSL